ncbi:hypothetical protein U6B65_10830 [Oscillospiraceae bacterium MB08-C2-2]|nr:hypothetical protein U6B65_10830 [Oscillospiraceae bacterium MB08-C2-2]
MTALVILLGIVALFAFLLLSPIQVSLWYREQEAGGLAQYLFIRFDFSPEGLAKREQRRLKRTLRRDYKKEEKAEPEKKPKSEKKLSALWDTIQKIWGVVRCSKQAMAIFWSGLRLERFALEVIAGGEDAHQIGEAYGRWCAALSAALPLLDRLLSPREPEITVEVDFFAPETAVDFAARIKITPLVLLRAAASFLITYIREEGLPKKSKGGAKKHEPATTASNQ